MKTLETTTTILEPLADNAKSYYGKAKLISDGKNTILISYTTEVALYNRYTKEITVNGWYSMTTARHINSFLKMFGFPTMTKKEMLKQGEINERRKATLKEIFESDTYGILD